MHLKNVQEVYDMMRKGLSIYSHSMRAHFKFHYFTTNLIVHGLCGNRDMGRIRFIMGILEGFGERATFPEKSMELTRTPDNRPAKKPLLLKPVTVVGKPSHQSPQFEVAYPGGVILRLGEGATKAWVLQNISKIKNQISKIRTQ